MPSSEAVDMGRFFRVVNVSTDLISGMFQVMKAPESVGHEAYVSSIDMAIYSDASKRSGLVYYSNDLLGKIEDGEVEIQEHATPRAKIQEVLDNAEVIKEAMLLAFNAARFEE